MKFGFCNNPLNELIAEIAWIGGNGFDYVDLCLEPDHASLEVIDLTAVRNCLEKYKLEAIGHLAWYLPIGSPLLQLRKAAISIAVEYICAMKELAVRAVTIHTNWAPRFFSVDKAIAWQVESLREIRAVAEEIGMELMLELGDSPNDSPENLQRILDQTPGVLCHLDLGHCNLFGRNPAAMLRQFAPTLYHVHAHDNNGLSDLHLPPGTGTICWEETLRVLKQIGYDRTITLEIFSPDRDYVLFGKKKLEELWAKV